MTRARANSPSIPNSAPMSSSTGVTIVDENGEMNVKHDTRSVAVHFRCCDQFSGFDGSVGPSQVITFMLSFSFMFAESESESESACG